MSAGFTGTAAHDDRRRRRMLTNQNEDAAESTVVVDHGMRESSRNHRYPVKRIIHYKAWRTLLLGVGLFLVGGGIVYGSWATTQYDLGPGFRMLFETESGRIYPCLWAGVLFLSGQLAWLAGWARSRSMTDFRGTFRAWRWIGLFLFASSFGVLIGADEVLNATLTWAGVQLPWSQPELNWMVPTGGAALLLLWLGDREMRISRLGRTHLWLGALQIVAALGAPFVAAVDVPLLVERGVLLSGLLTLFMSLAWFTRHVLYLSAEPAPRRRWRLTALLAKLLPARRTAEAGDEDAETDDAAADAAPSKRRRGAKKKPAPAPKPAAAEIPGGKSHKAASPVPEPHISATDDSQELPTVDDAELQERIQLMAMMIEEGEELDAELLKGLSKKQKRQLRKAWRDLERQYQGS